MAGESQARCNGRSDSDLKSRTLITKTGSVLLMLCNSLARCHKEEELESNLLLSADPSTLGTSIYAVVGEYGTLERAPDLGNSFSCTESIHVFSS
jgi:hypothetical protein